MDISQTTAYRIETLKTIVAIMSSAVVQIYKANQEEGLRELEQIFKNAISNADLPEPAKEVVNRDLKSIIGRARIDLHKKAKDRSINVQFTTSDNLINVDFSNRK